MSGTDLMDRYADPLAGAISAAQSGIPVIGLTSNTVPWEPFVAAGCFPVVLNPSIHLPSTESFADRYMEAVFEERIRLIFDMVASCAEVRLRAIVIPRTSEQEHKLFLYLRELSRLGTVPSMPEAHLYNLLHTRSAESESYGLANTRKLVHYAREVGMQQPTTERLRAAITVGNHCRRMLRELHQLRMSSVNTVSGTEALQWIGASYFMSRAEYAQLLSAALEARADSLPRCGKRLLIKGSPLSYLGLHEGIEQHRATVVAEDDWWGSRSGMPDMETDMEPEQSIFDSCYLHAQSPRVFPPDVADEWFLSVSEKVDAVIFYLPFEDDVYGWDYPRWRQTLNDSGIPHFLVRDDARRGMSASWHEEFEGFLSSI